MKEKILWLILILPTIFINAQTIELPNTVISVNYKYIDATNNDNAPILVKKLEDAIINYDNEEIYELYDNECDTYNVSFQIPEGKIIAAIDKNGKIIKTIEKYNNVRLPLTVMQSISNRFPNWGIIEDVYLVKYHCEANSLKKEYKIKIKNEDQIITVKTNEKGDFI
ncbi:nicotinate-nucleotide adenylyltransferase [Seonamhaeicola sp. MEBiC1930]|uniref:nicotinate-nucleotide adenylyltransferase n=1 Tax=Seonamhaeicola sp. MEBiC01930 TaxID=2976768 RepID=UPI0032430796